MDDKATVAQGSSLIPTSLEEVGATSSQKGKLDQLLVRTLFPSQATLFFLLLHLLESVVAPSAWVTAQRIILCVGLWRFLG